MIVALLMVGCGLIYAATVMLLLHRRAVVLALGLRDTLVNRTLAGLALTPVFALSLLLGLLAGVRMPVLGSSGILLLIPLYLAMVTMVVGNASFALHERSKRMEMAR